jgi:hypothetical protein
MAENERRTGPGQDLAGAEAAAQREAVVEVAGPDPKATRNRRAGANGATGDDVAGTASPASAVALSAPVAARPESISITQGGMDSAIADSVSVHQGGIGRAQAADIQVSMGGVGLARAERISVAMGGIGLAAGEHVEVSQGGATGVLARDAHLGPALIQTLVAQTVVVEKPTAVAFLVAQKVSGDVRTLFDWRGALAFGAAFGLVVGLFQRRR